MIPQGNFMVLIDCFQTSAWKKKLNLSFVFLVLFARVFSNARFPFMLLFLYLLPLFFPSFLSVSVCLSVCLSLSLSHTQTHTHTQA